MVAAGTHVADAQGHVLAERMLYGIVPFHGRGGLRPGVNASAGIGGAGLRPSRSAPRWQGRGAGNWDQVRKSSGGERKLRVERRKDAKLKTEIVQKRVVDAERSANRRLAGAEWVVGHPHSRT